MARYTHQAILNYNTSSRMNYFCFSEANAYVIKEDLNNRNNHEKVLLYYEDKLFNCQVLLKYTFDSNAFVLSISDLRNKTLDQSYNDAEKILNEVCKKLSFYFLKNNANSKYHIAKVSCALNSVSTVSDSSSLELSASLGVDSKTYIQPDDLSSFLSIRYESDFAKFISDACYRAAGDYNVRNVYYNLYSVIEYLEKNYGVFSNSTEILNKEDRDYVGTRLEEILFKSKYKFSNPSFDSVMKNKVLSHIKSSLSNLTHPSKDQKILNIIKNRYGIENVTYFSDSFNLDKALISEFRKMRNELFHTPKVTNRKKTESDETKEQQICVLNSKLIALSINIYEKEIKMESSH